MTKKHRGKTPWPNTMAKHRDNTPCQNTVAIYYDNTPLQNTVSKYDVNHVDWHNLTAEEVEAIRLYLKRTREKTNGEYIPDESSRW